MKDFFLIGYDQYSVTRGIPLMVLPECKGVVVTDENPSNRYILANDSQYLSKLEIIPIVNFLRYAKKNPGTVLVSFYDYPAGCKFLQIMAQWERYKLKIHDFSSFAFEYNLNMMYMPVEQERDIILDAMTEWKEFRKQLTDEFSKFTLDCYLRAFEKKDRYELLPAQMGVDHLYLNSFSRKLSMVPSDDEIFVDVGAWNGDTVVKFVDSCDGYRAIHAFEPIKRIFPKLKLREIYIDNLHTYPIALSNFTGEIDFVDNDTMGSRIPEEGSLTSHRVACSKLDDILDEATMMKIEVEGHEFAVLEGATKIIENCRPEICAQGYHYPLDPLRILKTVKNAHDYKHVAFRVNAVSFHLNSVLFSDRAPFE